MQRRTFLTAIAAPALAQTTTPWYRKAYRWGQTNITENDPLTYDIPWWRAHWKRTETQAVIINAGGIVAYYPSKFPLHYRAQFLNNRDLYGELTQAAHDDGIYVMARMDSNRTAENFFKAHPEWFTRDRNGNPYRVADKYITCVNSPYYDEYLPAVLTEIIERSHPEGITDNSWAGMGRENICYCDNCRRKFNGALPQKADWNDPAYRRWIEWNYQRRLEIWDLNNTVTRKAGGPHCIWSGMNSGSVSTQSRSFRDLREIARRADIMMLDHQRRDDDTGFQQNGDTGKRVHMLMASDGNGHKLAPESMAMYQSGPGYFRLASKTPAEARMWMIAGIAGGIQPWWHHIAATHEDRRMHRTAEPIMRWVKANQQYLINRQPVASIGLVWSQRNTDFYGRDNASDLTDAPYTGFMHALVRARIPYLPIHIDDVATTTCSALILPNIGALSNPQCAALKAFVAKGGSLLATGATSLYDEWGDPRPDYGLADIFGIHRITNPPAIRRTDIHTYLRLQPHQVLKGFEETNILPFGGDLTPIRTDPGATIPLTFIPEFPTYPPETSWMRTPRTDIPALILRQQGNSRLAFLTADIDRRYARLHLTDHGDLLKNIIHWIAADTIPVSIEGPGFLDTHLYAQGNKQILHIVNLTNATWRAPLEEFIPVGPIQIKLKTPARTAQLLVQSKTIPIHSNTLTIPTITDHEVAVLQW
ncbi:MAG: alpha-amylase family protein [Bryobacteraceae bacterium]